MSPADVVTASVEVAVNPATAFAIFSIGAVKKQSQTPSDAQSAASSSRSNISPSVMPMSRIAT